MSGKGDVDRRGGRMLPSQSSLVTPSFGGGYPWYNSKGEHSVQGETRELQRHSGAGYHKTPPALHRLLRCHTYSRHGNAAGARVMLKASKLGGLHTGSQVVNVGGVVGMGSSARSTKSMGIRLWLVRKPPVPIEFRRNEFRARGAMNTFHHYTTCAICLLRAWMHTKCDTTSI
jgi:hypothetical protein